MFKLTTEETAAELAEDINRALTGPEPAASELVELLRRARDLADVIANG
jgi:hypothetical protein